MKKLLIFFFASFLFAACNNNGGMGGGWSESDQNKFLNDCVAQSGNSAQAKQICSCVLEKLQKKYPSARDADQGTAELGQQLAMECMNGLNGNNLNKNGDDFNNNGKKKNMNNNDDDNGNNDNYNNNDNGGLNNNNNQIGSWTNQQRQQYIQGCSTAAQQNQGLSAQQANQYCDCMTRKVEERYSFQQAGRLTAQDFQTEEWQNIASQCRPQY
ncbi:MAG: hypothetical protein JJE22_17490 [Bacteroidia bacterium]|nr:hypothetical protein [Bacteroidia bacterium]